MNSDTIQLINAHFLYGLNRWSYSSVLETVIDIGNYEIGPTKDIDLFNQRLVEILPSLIEHHCSEGERGGFLQRLQTGTWLGHVLEHVAIELQRLVGLPFSFGQTRQIMEYESRYYMVFASSHEEIAKNALKHAMALLDACVYGYAFELDSRLADLSSMVKQYDGGISLSNQMVDAKQKRIPFLRRPNAHHLQLGYGCDVSSPHHHRLIGFMGEGPDVKLGDFLLRMLKTAGINNACYDVDPWTLLSNPDARVSIIETPLSILKTRGLVYQYPHCHVAVVSNIACQEDLKFYRCQVDALGPNGCAILNIDEEHVYELNKYVEGKIFYYSMQSSVEHLLDKIQNNMVIFWERNQKLFCWEQQQEKCFGEIEFFDKQIIRNMLIGMGVAKALNIPDHVVFSFIKNVALNYTITDL